MSRQHVNVVKNICMKIREGTIHLARVPPSWVARHCLECNDITNEMRSEILPKEPKPEGHGAARENGGKLKDEED